MIEVELVTQLCRSATEATGGVVVDVVRDPLDGSVWVRMSSWPRAQEALAALLAHGLSAVDRPDWRLQVTGWDVRLLRRRLGMLLAGVDDLREEWDATAELTRYHHDRRAAAGEEPEYFDVLADVEKAMRRAVPIPHRGPGTDDVDTLLQLIDAAEDAYTATGRRTPGLRRARARRRRRGRHEAGDRVMSYASDVEDEGEPNQSLDIAGQALLDFRERAPGLMSLNQPGWRYAPDAYRSLGELNYLATLLPQVMERIVGALQHEVELNLIQIDPGTEYEERPEAAVEAVTEALDGAVVAALVVAQSVADAQNAIARAAYAGPESDLHDRPPRVTVWSSPAAAGEPRHHGLVGTTYHASCTCGWPPLPATVDRQTEAEAEAEAEARVHAAGTGHLYEPPARW